MDSLNKKEINGGIFLLIYMVSNQVKGVCDIRIIYAGL